MYGSMQRWASSDRRTQARCAAVTKSVWLDSQPWPARTTEAHTGVWCRDPLVVAVTDLAVGDARGAISQPRGKSVGSTRGPYGIWRDAAPWLIIRRGLERPAAAVIPQGNWSPTGRREGEFYLFGDFANQPLDYI
jgi:hypothetical protein